MDEYPKYMCKAGGSEEVCGKLVQSGQAIDVEHEEKMLEDGWVYHPDELDAPTEAETTARARKGKPADAPQADA